ncbi:hypothetical protein HDU98_003924 [Podochytrium sp. JEL0797]|nr:hypothetical protein HDU98_003924 [Podochytrium sp. JEL0797]
MLSFQHATAKAKLHHETRIAKDRREISEIEKRAVNAVSALVKKQRALERQMAAVRIEEEEKKETNRVHFRQYFHAGEGGGHGSGKRGVKSGDKSASASSAPTATSTSPKKKLVKKKVRKVTIRPDHEDGASSPKKIQIPRVSGGGECEVIYSEDVQPERAIRSLSPYEQHYADVIIESELNDQTYRHSLLLFLQNLDTHDAATYAFLNAPYSQDEAGLPGDWREQSVAFGERLKGRIGELVGLYNEYFERLEGVGRAFRVMSPLDKYEIVKELGQGTFGSVLMAHNTKTGETVAIKQIKNKIENWDQLREVKALARLGTHPNIIHLKEVIRDHQADELHYVFEFMDGNLFDKMREVEAGGFMMPEEDVKSYTLNLKPENLLLSGPVLKIADFGLSREVSGPAHTEYVTTRWYRAPEILLKSPVYGTAMDMWSTGTIVAELVTLQAILPGSSELDQIFKTCVLVGSPMVSSVEGMDVPEGEVDARGYYTHPNRHIRTREEMVGGGVWDEGVKLAESMGFTFPIMNATPLVQVVGEHVATGCLEVMADMLRYDPRGRPSAGEVLEHEWFEELREAVEWGGEEKVRGRVDGGEGCTRSREETVVERPAFLGKERKESRVSVDDGVGLLRDREVSDRPVGRFSRQDTRVQEDAFDEIQTHQHPEGVESTQIQKEKRFIQQRRELSALEKVAVEAVQSLAVKQQQLQQHLRKLAKQGKPAKEFDTRGIRQRLMDRIQDAHTEKRAVDAVQTLVMQQKQMQRQLEKISTGGGSAGDSKIPVKKAASKHATKTSLYAAEDKVLALLPKKAGKKKKEIRKPSDSEHSDGAMKSVMENIDHFHTSGKKEHQMFRRSMIQFLRNLESEDVVSAEFLDTPISQEDADFPIDWKDKTVAFGSRLKERIGSLVVLYNEFFSEMEERMRSHTTDRGRDLRSASASQGPARAWTKDEDEDLKNSHYQFAYSSLGCQWDLVASALENRSAQECEARWLAMEAAMAEKPDSGTNDKPLQYVMAGDKFVCAFEDCGKEFESKRSASKHTQHCEYNPSNSSFQDYDSCSSLGTRAKPFTYYVMVGDKFACKKCGKEYEHRSTANVMDGPTAFQIYHINKPPKARGVRHIVPVVVMPEPVPLPPKTRLNALPQSSPAVGGGRTGVVERRMTDPVALPPKTWLNAIPQSSLAVGGGRTGVVERRTAGVVERRSAGGGRGGGGGASRAGICRDELDDLYEDYVRSNATPNEVEGLAAIPIEHAPRFDREIFSTTQLTLLTHQLNTNFQLVSQSLIIERELHGPGADESIYWESQLKRIEQNRKWAVGAFGESSVHNVAGVAGVDVIRKVKRGAGREFARGMSYQLNETEYAERERRFQKSKMLGGAGAGGGRGGGGGVVGGVGEVGEVLKTVPWAEGLVKVKDVLVALGCWNEEVAPNIARTRRRKGDFSVLEDALLARGISTFGAKDVPSIRAYCLPTKSIDAISTRIKLKAARGKGDSYLKTLLERPFVPLTVFERDVMREGIRDRGQSFFPALLRLFPHHPTFVLCAVWETMFISREVSVVAPDAAEVRRIVERQAAAQEEEMATPRAGGVEVEEVGGGNGSEEEEEDDEESEDDEQSRESEEEDGEGSGGDSDSDIFRFLVFDEVDDADHDDVEGDRDWSENSGSASRKRKERSDEEDQQITDTSVAEASSDVESVVSDDDFIRHFMSDAPDVLNETQGGEEGVVKEEAAAAGCVNDDDLFKLDSPVKPVSAKRRKKSVATRLQPEETQENSWANTTKARDSKANARKLCLASKSASNSTLGRGLAGRGKKKTATLIPTLRSGSPTPTPSAMLDADLMTLFKKPHPTAPRQVMSPSKRFSGGHASRTTTVNRSASPRTSSKHSRNFLMDPSSEPDWFDGTNGSLFDANPLFRDGAMTANTNTVFSPLTSIHRQFSAPTPTSRLEDDLEFIQLTRLAGDTSALGTAIPTQQQQQQDPFEFLLFSEYDEFEITAVPGIAASEAGRGVGPPTPVASSHGNSGMMQAGGPPSRGGAGPLGVSGGVGNTPVGVQKGKESVRSRESGGRRRMASGGDENAGPVGGPNGTSKKKVHTEAEEDGDFVDPASRRRWRPTVDRGKRTKRRDIDLAAAVAGKR